MGPYEFALYLRNRHRTKNLMGASHDASVQEHVQEHVQVYLIVVVPEGLEVLLKEMTSVPDLLQVLMTVLII